MNKLGRDLLLTAQEGQDEHKRQREAEEFQAEEKRRSGLLGKTLLAHTIERIPRNRAGVIIEPNKKWKVQERFLTDLELNNSFRLGNLNNLKLSVLGDPTSKFMNYKVLYEQNRAIDDDVIARFHADMPDATVKNQTSSTNLWYATGPELTPVEFQGEEYRFIRSLAGLFLPSVIKVLEAEGL